MHVADGEHSLRWGSPFGGDADVQLRAAHRADEGTLVGGVLALIFEEVGNVAAYHVGYGSQCARLGVVGDALRYGDARHAQGICHLLYGVAFVSDYLRYVHALNYFDAKVANLFYTRKNLKLKSARCRVITWRRALINN